MIAFVPDSEYIYFNMNNLEARLVTLP